ncbi:HEPN domain-containing protein [Candidatus Micrarchaeota archaeon]|nr:HEPN domain-containing protein [Candidatus Micrarchaeota archaeon]
MIAEQIRRGFLIKTVPDPEKAGNSIKIALRKLEKARKELDAGFYDDAVISAYTAMFHSARSLLFRDGFKERNHYVLYLYLEEKYGDKLKLGYLNAFNTLRTARHSLIYGDENLNVREVHEEEARLAVSSSEQFLQAVQKLLK